MIGAENFAILRSVITTARKQGWNIIEALISPSDPLIATVKFEYATRQGLSNAGAILVNILGSCTQLCLEGTRMDDIDWIDVTKGAVSGVTAGLALALIFWIVARLKRWWERKEQVYVVRTLLITHRGYVHEARDLAYITFVL